MHEVVTRIVVFGSTRSRCRSAFDALLVILALSSGPVSGQSRTGILAGGDLAWGERSAGAHTAGIGFHCGAMGIVDTSARFALRWEALFSSCTFSGALSQYPMDKAHYWTRIEQVRLPLLCSYQVSRKVDLLLGGAAAFNLAAHENGVPVSLGSGSLLLTAEAGLAYRFARMWQFSARYAHPLNSMAWGLRPQSAHLSFAYVIGAGKRAYQAGQAPGTSPDSLGQHANSVLEPEEYWRRRRAEAAVRKHVSDSLRSDHEQRWKRLVAERHARQDSLHPWSVPAHVLFQAGVGAFMPTHFTYPLPASTWYTDPYDNIMHVMTNGPGSSFSFGALRWSASSGWRAHLGIGLRFGYARFATDEVHHGQYYGGSTYHMDLTYRGKAVLERISVGIPLLIGARTSERDLVYTGVELRISASTIKENGTRTYSDRTAPDALHSDGTTNVFEEGPYEATPSNAHIEPFQIAWQFGYQRTIVRHLVAGLQAELCLNRLSSASEVAGGAQYRGGILAGGGVYVGWEFLR